jgi:hypothetical protein
MTVLKELSKCKLDLVAGQEVRWDNSGILPSVQNTFSYRMGNENLELGTCSESLGFWTLSIVRNSNELETQS